ncbi:MAG TPA: hypothetical protein VF169_17135 [Albitalea sp.]|uniref:hypothetical protein n=1 Tax=Piscinibacter sp. TaxID=1903157 RepID=UPI002ED3365C
MSLVSMSPFLRRVLVADALVSAAAGALMAAGASVLQDLLALPSGLLLAAGLALFPWAAALLWLARQGEVPRAAVWAVIVLNVLWIVESAWVALGGSFHPNVLGEAFIAVQAMAVAVLAELELIGLKRSTVAFA